MKILVVTPIVTKNLHAADDFERMVSPDTEVIHTTIDRGPASIESEFDEMLAIPDTVAKIMEGEAKGADAAFIDCMGDPGLKAAREVVRIPVVGPCEASMHMAAMLGLKFSVVTVLDAVIPLFVNNAKIYGVSEKLASVRSVDIPVLELEKDPEAMIQALIRESKNAVEQDGAHAIIFGCTGMSGVASQVQAGLTMNGYEGIPVIDPVEAGMRLAETWVRLGISHSKRTYTYPRNKPVKGYDFVPVVG